MSSLSLSTVHWLMGDYAHESLQSAVSGKQWWFTRHQAREINSVMGLPDFRATARTRCSKSAPHKPNPELPPPAGSCQIPGTGETKGSAWKSLVGWSCSRQLSQPVWKRLQTSIFIPLLDRCAKPETMPVTHSLIAEHILRAGPMLCTEEIQSPLGEPEKQSLL